MNKLIKFCNQAKIPYKENYEIKYDTYFKKGGKVKIYIQPNTSDSLISVLTFMNLGEYQYKLLGGTTNILLLDEQNYGIIISTKNVNQLKVIEEKIEVDAGYYLADLVRVALINGAKGYEGLEGVPGTIGGAIVMNAGAYGFNISDKIIDVTYIDGDGKLKVISKDACNFGFRTSIFKNVDNKNIIKATFCLSEKRDRSDIADSIEKFHIARHSYQEFAYPNLGSMYSTKRDMYREILCRSVGQKLLYWLFKMFLKNPITKFIKRKKPTNNSFNWLVKFFYKIEYPLSHKSINILINDGLKSDDEIIRHAKNLGCLYGINTKIENEIYIEQGSHND